MAKILIMDDEPGLRKIVFEMLKPTGHTLFLAEDGNQAIEIGKREKPDLALLDMRVPDYDGLQVVEHLKKMDPNIKCIMLSGFGDVESAVEAMKVGAFDYISKPFKVEEVLRAVNKALSAATPVKSSAPTSSTSAPAAVTIEVPKTYVPPKSKVGILAGAGIAGVVLLSLLIWKFASGGKDIFSIPYSNPSAIAWDGQNLWVADWSSQTIYKHKLDKNLTIAGTFSLVGIHPTGLAWDGKRLWSCSVLERKLTKHNMDNTLSSQITFLYPSQAPSVLAWDGAHLWVVDGADGKLYKLKTAGGALTIVDSHDGPAANPVGMFFYRNDIWLADGETGKIYQQDLNTLSIKGIYTLEPYASKTEIISAMTFDGKFIWTCAQKSGKIYRHKFSSLKKN